MSAEAVSLDPVAARNVADGVGGVLADVATASADTRRDDGAGYLYGATSAATTLLEEISQEMSLAANLLRAIADGTEAADTATTLGSLEAITHTVTIARSLHEELSESLADATGARPTDEVDPDLADGHSNALGHFGWLPLFDEDGATPDDVDQGQVGDCWLLSAYGSIAAVDPDLIHGLISDNGDGTYTVHFAEGDVTVDDQLPYRVNADGSIALHYAGGTIEPGMPIWPAIVEKAQAIAMGGDYDDISGDWAETAWDDLGLDSTKMSLNPRFKRDPSDTSIAELIESQIDAGLPITANADELFGLGGAHAWSVIGVEERGGETWVTVRNPWANDAFTDDNGVIERVSDGRTDFEGDDHGNWVELGDEGDGVISMRIDVFSANFDSLEYVEAP